MDCESNKFSNVISEENRFVYDAIKEFCMTVAENVGQMVKKHLFLVMECISLGQS